MVVSVARGRGDTMCGACRAFRLTPPKLVPSARGYSTICRMVAIRFAVLPFTKFFAALIYILQHGCQLRSEVV